MQKAKIQELLTVLQRLANGIKAKNLFLGSSLVLVVISTTTICLMAYFARPIADDYNFFNDPAIENPISFSVRMYDYYSGRIVQGFITSSGYVLFGEKAVNAVPALLLIMLVFTSALLASQFIPKSRNHTITSLVLGALFAMAILFTSPSLYDSLIWITSGTLYVSAVSYLLAVGALLVFLWKKSVGGRCDLS